MLAPLFFLVDEIVLGAGLQLTLTAFETLDVLKKSGVPLQGILEREREDCDRRKELRSFPGQLCRKGFSGGLGKSQPWNRLKVRNYGEF